MNLNRKAVLTFALIGLAGVTAMALALDPQREPPNKPPLKPVPIKPIKPASEPAKITAVSPPEITVSVRDEGTVFTVIGSNLAVLDACRVLRGGQEMPGITIEWAPATEMMRPAVIKLSKGITAGDKLTIQAGQGGKWMNVPATLKVVKSEAPAGAKGTLSKPGPGGQPAKPLGKPNNPPLKPNLLRVPAKVLVKEEFAKRVAEMTKLSKYKPDTTKKLPPRDGKLVLVDKGQKLKDEIRKQLPVIDEFMPPGKTAVFGSTLKLKGQKLDNATLRVRFKGTELDIIERHPLFAIAQLPSGGPQAVTGKLEWSAGPGSGTFWNTIASDYRLVREQDLQPRGTIVAISGGPLSPDNEPYEATRYNIHIQFEELPGSFLSDFEIDLQEPREINYGRPEFDFNTFDITITDTQLQSFGFGCHFKCHSVEDGPVIKTADINVPSNARGRPEITIENTWELRDIFNFQNIYAWGITSGTSSGPGGTFEVGVIENGNDLAIRIDSGFAMLGTEGHWISDLVALNNGWSVVELNWEKTCNFPEDDQCKMIVRGEGISMSCPGTIPRPDIVRFEFDYDTLEVGWKKVPDFSHRGLTVSFEPFVIGSNGNKLFQPSPFDRANYRYLRPLSVHLVSCGTLYNDHQLKVRLKSATLRGPEGVDWHEAFGEHYSAQAGPWYRDTMIVD